MKKSTMAIIVLFGCYIAVCSIIMGAIVDMYGPDSFQLFAVIIFIGPVFLILAASHDGIDKWLKGLDNQVK